MNRLLCTELELNTMKIIAVQKNPCKAADVDAPLANRKDLQGKQVSSLLYPFCER